jgi:CMP-N,N'-diacetyllegionaminic acid synthase
MRPLCVIPARRDSKRIPLKNIAPLNGLPMMGYTIRAALDSECFDTVYVSTEDPEIADLARAAGAQPHERPAELAGDMISATDVCLEVAERLGNEHEAVVCLQPSSPLRTAEHITQAWQRFRDTQADYLVSVTAIDPHYFHWAVRENEDGWWRMWFGSEFLKERPMLPPVFRPNGAIKIGRLDPLRRTGNFFGERLAVSEMDEASSLHVAVPSDLDLADYLLRSRDSKMVTAK